MLQMGAWPAVQTQDVLSCDAKEPSERGRFERPASAFCFAFCCRSAFCHASISAVFARVGAMAPGAQSSWSAGAAVCDMSALSRRKDEREFLDAHHWDNASAPGSRRIVDAHAIMPPAFYKHAQSTSAVKTAFANRPAALRQPIGKRSDETLLQRLEKNRAYRLDIKREINTSSEAKRITYLDRAREYVKEAPADEVRAMTEACAEAAPDWFHASRAAIGDE